MKILLLVLSIICTQQLLGQTIIQRDPEIEAMVKEISSDSLRSYINKMVSFGTRNTLSSTGDKKRGIGAARDWVVQKFNEFGKSSSGRLTAFVDTTTLQPDGRRVDALTSLGNAM